MVYLDGKSLEFFVSGDFYVSNGRFWNDRIDKQLLNSKGCFAACFSYSTRENIAMWMLYGADKGKRGALLNFFPSVMRSFLDVDSIELGAFDDKRKFISKYTLLKNRNDFSTFITDVIYEDFCKDGKCKLTLNDEHTTASKSILDHPSIFPKNITWQYERESRLVVKPSKKWLLKSESEKLSHIRLKVSKENLRKMDESRLVRSPVYSGNVDYGMPSKLSGDVIWEL